MSERFGEDPKSASLIGRLALVPQVLFLLMQLNTWHTAESDAVAFAPPNAIEAFVAVGAVVVCPILAITSGVSLIKSEANQTLGWALVVLAPILTILAFATRPQ